MIKSYLSSPVLVSKIAFALGWVLLISMTSWPGPVAIQVSLAVLTILFIVSVIMCIMVHGKVSAIFYELSQNKLLDAVPGLAWIAGVVLCSVSDDPVVIESVSNAASVILIIGLVFYPSPRIDKSEIY